MPKPPSPIDQCFRHWDPRWQTQPALFTNVFRHVVDTQNIRDHAFEHFKRTGSPMRLGRLLCPWDTVVFTWQEPTKNAGTAYKMALIQQHRFNEQQKSALSVVVVQYEGGGGPRTIVSGLLCISVPYDGLPIDAEDGTQCISASILGIQPLSNNGFTIARVMATALTTPEDLKMMEIAAKMQPDWGHSSQIDMTVICAALSFLNCKNVVTQEAGRTSPPPKWVKEGVPTVKYHVIKIDGRLVKRTGESATETGRHLSLHVCRGSFAHYTAEKPLFGKYAGDFWRPQHTRGSAEVGTVEKTYKIVPPGAT